MQIVDVDFRWAERVLTAGHGGNETVKVLQWRKKIGIGYTDDRTSMVKYPGEEWTDWQDVRTEAE